jgi:hypothetical protein
MTLEDYKQCLFWDGSMARNARELAINQFNAFKCTGQKSSTNQYTPYRVNISLRSFKHQMKSISTVKLALNRFDDKGLVLENQINTRTHGHYRIE